MTTDENRIKKLLLVLGLILGGLGAFLIWYWYGIKLLFAVALFVAGNNLEQAGKKKGKL